MPKILTVSRTTRGKLPKPCTRGSWNQFRSLLEATVKAKLARIRWNHISRMTSRFVLGPAFKIARRAVKFNPLYGVRLNSKRVTITSLFPWKQRTRTDFETRNSDTLRVSSHLQRTGSRSKSK